MLQASYFHDNQMGKEIPASLTDSRFNPCWIPFNQDTDYFNLLAFNEKGKALVLEDLSANSAWGSWHLISGVLAKGDDPTTAAQQKLLHFTGHRSDNWLYLGSFMLNPTKPDVNGHFFAALGAQMIQEGHLFYKHDCCLQWVSRKDLKYALLDGRIGMMSYAVTTSLALLLSPNGSAFPLIR